MDISYQYTKLRCNFGRQPMFCEQGPLLCDSIATAVPEHKHYMLRNPVHQLTQHTPCYSEHHINTIRAEITTSGANHAEGGWPKDVPVIDPEATQRYRRKVEKDDNYVHCVMSIAPGVDHYVMQNNAIDMYRTYYSELPAAPAPERVGCRTVNVYRDPPPARPVSSICWQPEAGSRFAVSYLDVDRDRNPRAPIMSYIWDVENANHPESTIAPPCALVDLQYNPREPAQLAGGLVNGQVAVWDRRKGPGSALSCPPHVAHRDLVRNVIFINAKSGQEFFSGGPDGACKWWDVRNMSEPTEEMIIDVPKSSFDVQSMANATGASALEFEPTIPTRFMCGTENGFIVGGNRKGKTPMEKLPAKFEAHLGPVWSVERNPGFLKNFLTVGDWTARVWSEDCRESAVVWSPPHRHKITAGTWSPQRSVARDARGARTRARATDAKLVQAVAAGADAGERPAGAVGPAAPAAHAVAHDAGVRRAPAARAHPRTGHDGGVRQQQGQHLHGGAVAELGAVRQERQAAPHADVRARGEARAHPGGAPAGDPAEAAPGGGGEPHGGLHHGLRPGDGGGQGPGRGHRGLHAAGQARARHDVDPAEAVTFFFSSLISRSSVLLLSYLILNYI